MPADLAIALENVTRTFGPAVGVVDVSLTVGRGEIICLVGQSGCGKSTLLRLIAGVEVPDSGSIRLKGGEVSGAAGFVEPEKRNVGFVFQDYALFPHLTVMQNILFGLKGRPKAEAAATAADVIARVGIGHLGGRYPHMLSGGEQQRVALARALAPQPDILLMDEPFSNLDRGLRDRVREDTLSLLKSLGTTVVMVTHDPEEALSAGDRVVLMRAGRVVQVGSGYDLYERPVSPYAAEFFCAFNKVPGIYRDGHVETGIGRFAYALDLGNGAPSMLYIPPMGITISSDEGDLAGRIVGRTFHGEIEQFAVAVDGLAEPLRIRSTLRVAPDSQAVRLSISSDRLLAFS